MVKRARRSNPTLNYAAENIGSALGHVAARLDAWKKDRAAIAADIQSLMKVAEGMLGNLSDTAISGFGVARDAAARARKGGRPKGYKMSEATKHKLRAAWKRRKAAASKGV